LRHDAGGGVHRNAAGVAASHFNLAGVQTGPHGQADLLGSRPKGERASDRPARSIECRQDSIAGILDQIAAVFFNHLPGKMVVSVERSPPGQVAHRSRTARRIDNIGKKHRRQDPIEFTCRTLAVSDDKFWGALRLSRRARE